MPFHLLNGSHSRPGDEQVMVCCQVEQSIGSLPSAAALWISAAAITITLRVATERDLSAHRHERRRPCALKAGGRAGPQ